jgi:hypothetical protein
MRVVEADLVQLEGREGEAGRGLLGRGQLVRSEWLSRRILGYSGYMPPTMRAVEREESVEQSFF